MTIYIHSVLECVTRMTFTFLNVADEIVERGIRFRVRYSRSTIIINASLLLLRFVA